MSSRYVEWGRRPYDDSWRRGDPSMAELAEGSGVSAQTVWRWHRRGLLPAKDPFMVRVMGAVSRLMAGPGRGHRGHLAAMSAALLAGRPKREDDVLVIEPEGPGYAARWVRLEGAPRAIARTEVCLAIPASNVL